MRTQLFYFMVLSFILVNGIDRDIVDFIQRSNALQFAMGCLSSGALCIILHYGIKNRLHIYDQLGKPGEPILINWALWTNKIK